jgi:hypothetical protein
MSSAAAAADTLTAAAPADLGSTATFRLCDVTRAAIAEACLPALGVIARLGAVARIESIGLRLRLLRLAEISLLPIEGSLLAGLPIWTFPKIRPLSVARTFAKIAAIAWTFADIGAVARPFAVAWTSIAVWAITIAWLAFRLQHLLAAPPAIVELPVA